MFRVYLKELYPCAPHKASDTFVKKQAHLLSTPHGTTQNKRKSSAWHPLKI